MTLELLRKWAFPFAAFATVAALVHVRVRTFLPNKNVCFILDVVLLLVAMAHSVAVLLCVLWGRDVIQFSMITNAYPELLSPQYEEQFDDACEIRMQSARQFAAGTGSLQNLITDQVDGYVVSHVFGWALGTAMCADPFLAYAISLFHEVLESFYSDVYPQFAECWWDKYILDFGGNALGSFILGPLVMWLSGTPACNHFRKPFNIVVMGSFLWNLIMFPLVFWMPHVLGIPPKHPTAALHAYLLILVWSRLYYNYGFQNVMGRSGNLPWGVICHGILGLELVCVYKLNAVCTHPLPFDIQHAAILSCSWLASLAIPFAWQIMHAPFGTPVKDE